MINWSRFTYPLIEPSYRFLAALFDQSRKKWNSVCLREEAGLFITRSWWWVGGIQCGNRCISARCNPAPLIALTWMWPARSNTDGNWQQWIDRCHQRVRRESAGRDTRMWRKCLVLRSASALGKPLIIQVNGSADCSVPPGWLYQQWVGSKTNGFDVDSRMQEADEQTEGKKKKSEKKKSVRAGGELERREGARALGLCCPLMPGKC